MLVVNLGLTTSPTSFPLPQVFKIKTSSGRKHVLLVKSFYLDKYLNTLISMFSQVKSNGLYVILFQINISLLNLFKEQKL